MIVIGPIGLMLKSARRARLQAWGRPILRDGAEPVIGPRFVRTRWRLLRMRAGRIAR